MTDFWFDLQDEKSCAEYFNELWTVTYRGMPPTMRQLRRSYPKTWQLFAKRFFSACLRRCLSTFK